MREIRPSGSGEGAVLSRPYLISSERVMRTIRAISSQRSSFDPYSFDSPVSEFRLLGRFAELSICGTRTGMHEFDDCFGGGISYALLGFRSLQ
jgi:hypothetical protein